MEKFSPAIQELADLATCISADFHHLHFNFAGAEFDEMHKDVLKTYYEQAADDADEFGEWCTAFDENHVVQNQSEAADRLMYTPCNKGPKINKETAVLESKELLETLCSKYLTVFKALEKENCPLCVGLANFIQGRLEYWAKEMAYFNARRQ